jgi:SAM-dependent methyltransferase
MLKRIKDKQGQAFVGIESARAYAEEARSPVMQRVYSLIMGEISRLGVTGKFLEIGPGPAVLTTMVAQAIPEAHITAVEISPGMITVAREHVEREGLTERGGILLIHDLKRVWWLYWIPSQEGFITSIRAAYTPAEIRDLLTRMGVDRYEIKNGLFWQSVIVRT